MDPLRDLRHGDWLVMRRMPAAAWAQVAGEVALCAVPDEDIGESYLLKRVVRAGEGWSLRSDNPAHPSHPVGERTRLVARVITVVRPEDLGPAVGTVLGEDAIPGRTEGGY